MECGFKMNVVTCDCVAYISSYAGGTNSIYEGNREEVYLGMLYGLVMDSIGNIYFGDLDYILCE